MYVEKIKIFVLNLLGFEVYSIGKMFIEIFAKFIYIGMLKIDLGIATRAVTRS